MASPFPDSVLPIAYGCYSSYGWLCKWPALIIKKACILLYFHYSYARFCFLCSQSIFWGILFLCLFYSEWESYSSPGWPQIHGNSPVSASQMLRLQACTRSVSFYLGKHTNERVLCTLHTDVCTGSHPPWASYCSCSLCVCFKNLINFLRRRIVSQLHYCHC